MTTSNITPEGQLKGRILLAEDDEDMRRFLAKALENAGFEVTSFDNGSSLMRFPVAAKMALPSAGTDGGVPI